MKQNFSVGADTSLRGLLTLETPNLGLPQILRGKNEGLGCTGRCYTTPVSPVGSAWRARALATPQHGQMLTEGTSLGAKKSLHWTFVTSGLLPVRSGEAHVEKLSPRGPRWAVAVPGLSEHNLLWGSCPQGLTGFPEIKPSLSNTISQFQITRQMKPNHYE